MDKKKIKRIIAREGLILLGIIVFGFIIIAASDLYIKMPSGIDPTFSAFIDNETRPIEIDKTYAPRTSDGKLFKNLVRIKYLDTGETKVFKLANEEARKKIMDKRENIKKFGYFILFLSYPLYLFIRFILWAIKKLRKKDIILKMNKKQIVVIWIGVLLFIPLFLNFLFSVLDSKEISKMNTRIKYLQEKKENYIKIWENDKYTSRLTFLEGISRYNEEIKKDILKKCKLIRCLIWATSFIFVYLNLFVFAMFFSKRNNS